MAYVAFFCGLFLGALAVTVLWWKWVDESNDAWAESTESAELRYRELLERIIREKGNATHAI